MSREHIDHKQIADFATDRVNLPVDNASGYREQVNRLREKLENYLSDHPDFALKKMLLSGSLAKGTALRTLNDVDVACYISGADTPEDIQKLLNYLAERLRNAFPNFSADQIKPQTYSVTVSFKGSGLDVDVVPILYRGDPDWYGDLVSQDDGSLLKTCIPRHLQFFRARKNDHPTHFAQVVRLVKYWAKRMKTEREGFRLKSFMIEMILCKLSDQGDKFDDYIEGMQHFFTYVAKSNLNELVVFEDYYAASEVGQFIAPVKIIDPVNAKNNVSRLYTRQEVDLIVDAAIDAGDAIDAALKAPNQGLTVGYWQKVFGTGFTA